MVEVKGLLAALERELRRRLVDVVRNMVVVREGSTGNERVSGDLRANWDGREWKSSRSKASRDIVLVAGVG